MPETHIPIEIEVDGTTYVFNDFGTQDHLRVEEFEIRKPVRYEEANNPQRDGVLIPATLFRGGGYPTLRGIVDPGASLQQRSDRADQLEEMAERLRINLGVLRWTPAGKPQRRMAVRLHEDLPARTRGIVLEWDLMLVSPDPLEYEETLNDEVTSPLEDAFGSGDFSYPYSYPYSYGAATIGGEVIITPGGNADTYPTVVIDGPLLSPGIRNDLTGESVSFPGLQINDGQSLVIDHRAETALLGGFSDVLSKIDWVGSSLWRLVHGQANTVRLTGTGFDAGTQATIFWRNAYA